MAQFARFLRPRWIRAARRFICGMRATRAEPRRWRREGQDGLRSLNVRPSHAGLEVPRGRTAALHATAAVNQAAPFHQHRGLPTRRR